MDFIFVALGGLLWFAAYGLLQICAQLQKPEVR